MDFDGNCDFLGTDETVTTTVASGTADGSSNLGLNVPMMANTTEPLGTCVRLSTDTGLGPDGPANDGEVEDHVVTVQKASSAGDSLGKWLNMPEPARAGEVISFIIRIINTRDVALSKVRILDQPHLCKPLVRQTVS